MGGRQSSEVWIPQNLNHNFLTLRLWGSIGDDDVADEDDDEDDDEGDDGGDDEDEDLEDGGTTVLGGVDTSKPQPQLLDTEALR